MHCIYLNHWLGHGPEKLVGGHPPFAASLNLYELDEYALQADDVLLLPAHVDQRFLVTQQEKLVAFINAGGTIVINGHVAHPFLPWLTPFEPVVHPHVNNLQIQREQAHPIFEHVDVQDLTFRKGVAGFYARGGNPAPAGAVIIHTISEQCLPVDWVYTLPGGGRILMHSGNDLWTFNQNDDSTRYLLPQLKQWLQGEIHA